MNRLRLLAAFATICCTVQPAPLPAAKGAAAASIVYRANLSGKAADPATLSAATGQARIRIDLRQKRISLQLTVRGIRIADLRQDLLRSRMGPIHLHQYIKRADGTREVVLVLPVPYGDSYHETKDGFVVALKSIDYVEGAKVLNSPVGFDDFVTAMGSGNVLLNVHTTRYPDGEISGYLAKRSPRVVVGQDPLGLPVDAR